MGLLEQIAAAAIRNRIIAGLRDNCPAPLKEPMEALLADKEAVAAFQKLATDARAGKAQVSAESIAALPLAAATATLLQDNPRLVKFLVMAASRLQKN